MAVAAPYRKSLGKAPDAFAGEPADRIRVLRPAAAASPAAVSPLERNVLLVTPSAARVPIDASDPAIRRRGVHEHSRTRRRGHRKAAAHSLRSTSAGSVEHARHVGMRAARPATESRIAALKK